MEIEAKEERYRILVSTILTNKATIGKGVWEMGLALKEMQEKELYLLEFRSFKEFLAKKVELSERTARRCIEITSEFDLRDFCKWGVSKLEIIKREFPEETKVERTKFVRKSNVASIRELPEEISRFKHRVGIATDSQEEELKIIRQFGKIEAFLGTLIESLANLLANARKHPQNETIQGLIVKAEQIIKKL